MLVVGDVVVAVIVQPTATVAIAGSDSSDGGEQAGSDGGSNESDTSERVQ